MIVLGSSARMLLINHFVGTPSLTPHHCLGLPLTQPQADKPAKESSLFKFMHNIGHAKYSSAPNECISARCAKQVWMGKHS